MIAIAAVSNNWVIGKDGKIPWRSREDMEFFKSITDGKKLIVGRKTFESLPVIKRPVAFYVLTNSVEPLEHISGRTDKGSGWENWGIAINSLDIFKGFPEDDEKRVVIGGASVYRKLLPECETLYLTVFDFAVDGDTFFPYSPMQIDQLFPKRSVEKKLSNGVIYKCCRA